jgi:hypothetical protein
MALASSRRVGVLNLGLILAGRLELRSRAFSSLATRTANPIAIRSRQGVGGQNADRREPASRMAQVDDYSRRQHDDVHLAVSFAAVQ